MKIKFNFLSILLIILFLTVQKSDAQDELLFRRHVINSGWNGLLYGIAFDVIAEVDGAAIAGIPVITAGTSILVPILRNPDRSIDYDALVLSIHGKTLGWAHGVALATLIGGEEAFDSYNSNNYKFTIGAGAATSIGMGILGSSLGKNNDWTEGQVELYRLYGWLMPFAGLSLMASFSEEPRLYGASVLVFGAGGYLIGDRINNWYDYTRGEVRATQVLTLLNLGLGFGILAETEMEEVHNPYWMIPAGIAIAGTMVGHKWLQNTNLTPQQGMLTAYAACGGVVLGLGIALLIESDVPTPYYLIPYATGLGAYGYTVERLRRKNNSQDFLNNIKGKNNFNLTLMPQNLFLNNRINDKGYMVEGSPVGLQPLFTATVRF
ncbi:MAG: hypothetical protein AMS27_10380 [Bacteroides sp. SM23_62_1]|nr:MAG: hypothetical protein AMS27_10380 [Bacteroides sp. SM23_62_1]